MGREMTSSDSLNLLIGTMILIQEGLSVAERTQTMDSTYRDIEPGGTTENSVASGTSGPMHEPA
jgi:hypothetical protein